MLFENIDDIDNNKKIPTDGIGQGTLLLLVKIIM